MKKEIQIPEQYAEVIKAEAEKKGIDIDAVVHIALKKYLERRNADAE